MVNNTTARTRGAAALAAAASIALIGQGVVPAQAAEGGPTCRWVCSDAEGNPIDNSNCNVPGVPVEKPAPGGCQPGGAGEGAGEGSGAGEGEQPAPKLEEPEQPGQQEQPGDADGEGTGEQPNRPEQPEESEQPGGNTGDNAAKKPGFSVGNDSVGSTVNGGLKSNLDAVIGSSHPGGSSLAANPRCAAALAGVGLPLAALVPLGLGSKLQLPGVNNLSAQLNAQARNLNTEVQRGLGIHNPRLSEQAAQVDNQLKALGTDLGSVAAGAGTVAATAAALGAIAYACSPQTGQGSSAEGSSINIKKGGEVEGWGNASAWAEGSSRSK